MSRCDILGSSPLCLRSRMSPAKGHDIDSVALFDDGDPCLETDSILVADSFRALINVDLDRMSERGNALKGALTLIGPLTCFRISKTTSASERPIVTMEVPNLVEATWRRLRYHSIREAAIFGQVQEWK